MRKLLASLTAAAFLALPATAVEAAPVRPKVAYVQEGSDHALYGWPGLYCHGPGRVTIHPGESKKPIRSLRSDRWNWEYKLKKGRATYFRVKKGTCISMPPGLNDPERAHYFSARTR